MLGGLTASWQIALARPGIVRHVATDRAHRLTATVDSLGTVPVRRCGPVESAVGSSRRRPFVRATQVVLLIPSFLNVPGYAYFFGARDTAAKEEERETNYVF